MPNQSFPPVSLLKGLKSFRLDLEIPDFAECLDQDLLRKQIADAITGAGLTFVEDASKSCDALLHAQIRIIHTLSEGTRPVAFAYIVRLCALTTVSGYPSTELFIVWHDVHFGSIDALRLSTTIQRSVSAVASSLVKRLTE